MEEKCKFCGYKGTFKECGFPGWNLRFECPKYNSIRIDKEKENLNILYDQFKRDIENE